MIGFRPNKKNPFKPVRIQVVRSGKNFSVAEGETAVTTIQAVGAASIAYSLFDGGADNGSFTLNPSTGAITFSIAPDFETPADADANNVYEIYVGAYETTEEILADAITLFVTVTDVAE